MRINIVIPCAARGKSQKALDAIFNHDPNIHCGEIEQKRLPYTAREGRWCEKTNHYCPLIVKMGIRAYDWYLFN